MLRWIIIGAVVLAVLGALGYFAIGGGPAARKQKSKCDGLKASLTDARNRGDANAVASLTSQLSICNQELASQGQNVDVQGGNLANCIATFSAITPSLSDLIATSRADWLKRMNIWGNILHFGSDAAACMANAGQAALTKDDLQKVHDATLSWGIKTRAIQNRLYQSSHGGEAGLDAYSGSPEPGGDDKAHAFMVSVVDPMWATLRAIDTKLSALDPSNAALTAELAALSAGTSAPANGIFGP